MADGSTSRVAELVVATSLSEIPAQAICLAKDALFDTVGVTLAGHAQPGGRMIVGFVRAQGGAPAASILGAGFQSSPWAAALANGTTAAILDYDDDNCHAMSHLSGSLLPAVLSLAEAHHQGGAAMLEAYLVGYEAACKIGLGVLPGQYLGGRHPTGSLGVMGATAACSKLLGLDAEKTAVALGIAASAAGAVRANFGTMTKGLHSGLAASNAVLAASLAAQGFTARPDILEAKYGYAHTTMKDGSSRLGEVGKGWGDPWHIVDPGNGIKFQPSGSMSHCAGQCARELALRHDIRLEDVESIECKTTALSMDVGSYGVPDTPNEAMYSTPWAIAVAIADRKTGLAQFRQERVNDPRVRALAARVKMTVHPDWAVLHDIHDIRAAEVVITLKDGRSVSQFRRRPRGFPGGEPWTDEMLEEKFREAAGFSLESDRIERAMGMLRRLEELADVAELAAVLRGPDV